MRASITLLAAAAALGVAAAGPARADGPYQMVVPPGQEKRLGAMAGMGDVVLPGGCRLETAATVKSVVRLRYLCGQDRAPLAVELHPPGHAGEALATTTKFVLTRGTGEGAADPPTGFVDALAERLRAGEGRWHWMKVRGDHQAADAALLPTPPAPSAPTDGVELDPKHVELFEEGAALYRELKHAEALERFLALARENPRFGGVLGMVVANLAPTKPDAAAVAALVAKADAAPDDRLAQFLAGVAAHYSAHYKASTPAEKQRLYEACIRHLERTRPDFEFEPRLFIYLAVSHYRLGNQAEAEALIERAVKIAKYDPDAYYCRAEIYHRTKVERSLDDLETYLEMTRKFADAGGWAADEKILRVEQMRDYLKRVQAGEETMEEVFDPLASDTPGAGSHAPAVPAAAEAGATPSETARAMASPQTYGRWAVAIAAGATLLGLLGWALVRRRRDDA